ncbi:hypothetical protein ABIA32_004874 [Streptacidiphilus sp. MAP12-20]|uniref:hypothetical protein n=1 Tax=Streptacidiphilus sp. MAP12-20 TaxID=3156299 RepID=UPI003517036E
MKRSSVHRAVALATAAAALAFGMGAGAADATTAPKPVVTLATPIETALPAAPGTAQTNWQWTANQKNVNVNDAVVVIDARGLAKVATVTFSGNCTAQGLVATCPDMFWGASNQQPYNVSSSTGMTLSALKGAKQGATGWYRVYGSSQQGTIRGAWGEVTVGGPRYQLNPLVDHKKQRIGTVISEPVTFANDGTRGAASSEALLMISPGLSFVDHYSNCDYRSYVHAGLRYEDWALCHFKSPLRVGEQVTLARSVRTQFTREALYTYLDVQVTTEGDPSIRWATAPVAGSTWHRGSGAVLGLRTLKAGRATGSPNGVVPLPGGNGYGIASLYAVNTADFGVTGGSAKAAKSRTVTFYFTEYNRGPASLFDRSGGEGTPAAMVTPPPGTTIVGASNCQPHISGDPTVAAHGPYVCWGSMDYFWAGRVDHFSLTVRVDRVIPGALGKVWLQTGPIPGGVASFDPNRSNDATLLHLN